MDRGFSSLERRNDLIEVPKNMSNMNKVNTHNPFPG